MIIAVLDLHCLLEHLLWILLYGNEWPVSLDVSFGDHCECGKFFRVKNLEILQSPFQPQILRFEGPFSAESAMDSS